MNAPPLARPQRPATAYMLAVAGSIAAVATAQILQRWLGVNDLSLVFMLAVLVVASRTRTGPAALTAVLCFLAYNFFFIEPRYTLYIGASHSVATVLAFLAAALLAARLATRLSEQIEAMAEAQRHGAARQALGQQLAVAADESDVVRAAHDGFRHALDAEAWHRLDGHARHESVEDQGWWMLPLRTPDRVLGTLGLKLPDGLPRLEPGERDVARAMADDITQALLRTRLVAELEAQRVAAETERLRSGLLASVSHDLRTPLASIIGAAETLEAWGDDMAADDRSALLATVREEGLRLDRYIQNLLDMTRLGHGVAPVRDWFGLDELIGAAIARVQRHRPHARVDVDAEASLPPVFVQGALIEQALYNVIDNALKFGGDRNIVEVDLRRNDTSFDIVIRDHGPGIPEVERERVFEMFHRVERGDRGPSGTGLGLAIARAIVLAHQGTIAIEPAAEGGACVRITLPTGDAA